MTKRFIPCAILIAIPVLLTASLALAQTRSSTQEATSAVLSADLKISDLLAQARRVRRPGFALMPSLSVVTATAPAFTFIPMAGPSLPVLGSGTVGRLTKWTGITSSNSFIGDSTIFESKLGLVGIGTDTPTSKLTVAGTIQSLSGGFQFPDGTIQTTSSAGALFSVAHDATLMGNGTISSPLGITVPLSLSGSTSSLDQAVLTVTNAQGIGVLGVSAAAGIGMLSPPGVKGIGGFDKTDGGGVGVFGLGGDSVNAFGGAGVRGLGGNSLTDRAGEGVHAQGGESGDGDGGTGLFTAGGSSVNGNGGRGLVIRGGNSSNNSGGVALVATPGTGLVNDGLAGLFLGTVEISGNLNVVGTKNFKMDHPLDPENKYLYHAAVESAEVLNIYSGNVTTNNGGEAIVTLPDWFEALNHDLRYQLTVIGTFAQAIVAEKVKRNRFIIRTNAPNVEVSWQVTGVRSDRALTKYPFKAEMDKPDKERGTYLNPEAYGQPEGRGLDWVRERQQVKQPRVEGRRRIIDQ